MKQPDQHKRAPHGNWADRWNHYRERQRTYMLDRRHFEAMIVDAWPDGRCVHDVGCLFDGSLDAPEYIPGGSTESIRTIGGYERENYHRLPRWCDDFSAYQRASSEMAGMLAKILSDTDDNS